jgi:hypothetical protein
MSMLAQAAYPLIHSEIGNFGKSFQHFACGQSVDGGVSRMRFLGYEGLLRGITILQVPYERNALRSEARVGTFR